MSAHIYCVHICLSMSRAIVTEFNDLVMFGLVFDAVHELLNEITTRL